MNDYAMHSAAGDVAVEAIIEYHAQQAEDHNQLFDLVCQDLERLRTVAAFEEATDTEVREQVYEQCQKAFPIPVFKSIRA